MDAVGVGVDGVQRHAGVAGRGTQLAVQVLPLADAQEVQELLAQHPAEPVARQRLPLLVDVVPEVAEGEEVGAVGVDGRAARGPRPAEAAVLLVGGLAVFGGPLPRVLDREGGGDDEHLAQAAVAVGLDEHAAQPRVDRQRGERAADGCQTAGAVERTQLVQQREAVGDGTGVGRVDERERRDVAQLQRDHLQHDGREVGPQDLGVGELRARVEVVLGVEADADAVRDAATPPGPLVGAGLGDLLDRQPLHLEPARVAGDPRGARVDHVVDARHRQRRLGDVGGEHDAAAGVRLEHPLLLGDREPRVERHDLGVAEAPLAEGLGRLADLPLARQEHEDVAPLPVDVAFALQLGDGVADRVEQVAIRVGVRVVRVDDRPVAHLDREAAPGDLDDGGGEVLGEALHVDRRRGDHDLEVGAAGEQLGQVAEDEVDVEAALVGLVDDQRVVLQQRAITRQLGEQDAIGHQLDQRVLADLVGEPDLPADGVAQLGGQLLGDAGGDGAGGQAAGLGVPDHAAHAAAQLQADLRDLRGLARARLAGDDHDLVLADRGGDVVAPRADRQRRGIGDGGDGGATGVQPFLRGVGGGHDAGQRAPAGDGVAGPAGGLEAPREAVLLADRQLRDARGERGDVLVAERGDRAGLGRRWLLLRYLLLPAPARPAFPGRRVGAPAARPLRTTARATTGRLDTLAGGEGVG